MNSIYKSSLLKALFVASVVVNISALEDPNIGEEFRGESSGDVILSQLAGKAVDSFLNFAVGPVDSGGTSQHAGSQEPANPAPIDPRNLVEPLDPVNPPVPAPLPKPVQQQQPKPSPAPLPDPIPQPKPLPGPVLDQNPPVPGDQQGQGPDFPEESLMTRMGKKLAENKRNIGIAAVVIVGVGITALLLKKYYDKKKKEKEARGEVVESWSDYAKKKLSKISRRHVGIALGAVATVGVLSQCEVTKKEDSTIRIIFPKKDISLFWNMISLKRPSV